MRIETTQKDLYRNKFLKGEEVAYGALLEQDIYPVPKILEDAEKFRYGKLKTIAMQAHFENKFVGYVKIHDAQGKLVEAYGNGWSDDKALIKVCYADYDVTYYAH